MEGGGLKKEGRVRRVQKGAFESTLIKAGVMDRTCGRVSFLSEHMSVCVWGGCEGGRGRAAGRDVYCQQSEWDKDLNRNFKATFCELIPSPYPTLHHRPSAV